jgi:hypothetical protein
MMWWDESEARDALSHVMAIRQSEGSALIESGAVDPGASRLAA